MGLVPCWSQAAILLVCCSGHYEICFLMSLNPLPWPSLKKTGGLFIPSTLSFKVDKSQADGGKTENEYHAQA